MNKNIKELKTELSEQLVKVNKSLKILNSIEKQYDKYDIKTLKKVLIDLIGGYKSTLEGLKSTYHKELKQ